MKTKWTYNILIILGTVLLIASVNLQLLLMIFVPDPFLYYNMPFPLNKREYTSTDRIIMSVGRCSSENKPVAVVSVKELYNTVTGDITPLSPGSGIIPPGCSLSDTAFASIFPAALDNGVYVIRGTTTFRGRFSTIDVSWQTQSFVYRKE